MGSAGNSFDLFVCFIHTYKTTFTTLQLHENYSEIGFYGVCLWGDGESLWGKGEGSWGDLLEHGE